MAMFSRAEDEKCFCFPTSPQVPLQGGFAPTPGTMERVGLRRLLAPSSETLPALFSHSNGGQWGWNSQEAAPNVPLTQQPSGLLVCLTEWKQMSGNAAMGTLSTTWGDEP